MLGDDVDPGTWGEAAMLVSAALDGDKERFGKLEGQVKRAWMPEALACIAARALRELSECRGVPAEDLLTAIMNSGPRYGPV